MIGTAAVVSNRNAAALAESQETTAELAQLANWSLRVSAEPDATRISLVGSPGTKASGTLLYSPTSTDLVVVARGLAPAPAGQEYRCWVLVDGSRHDVGLMDIGAGLAYWVGPVPGLDNLPAGTPFGVSLAQVNGPITSADPVLSGTSADDDQAGIRTGQGASSSVGVFLGPECAQVWPLGAAGETADGGLLQAGSHAHADRLVQRVIVGHVDLGHLKQGQPMGSAAWAGILGPGRVVRPVLLGCPFRGIRHGSVSSAGADRARREGR